MRLVLIQPAGQALRGADARAFVADAEAVIAHVARGPPRGHARAHGRPRDRRGDRGHAHSATSRSRARSRWCSRRWCSSLIFRRVRALVAVMPPLVLGTLWTAGLAAVLPGGLSAIAVAFTSVVVGVGRRHRRARLRGAARRAPRRARPPPTPRSRRGGGRPAP